MQVKVFCYEISNYSVPTYYLRIQDLSERVVFPVHQTNFDLTKTLSVLLSISVSEWGDDCDIKSAIVTTSPISALVL